MILNPKKVKGHQLLTCVVCGNKKLIKSYYRRSNRLRVTCSKICARRNSMLSSGKRKKKLTKGSHNRSYTHF